MVNKSVILVANAKQEYYIYPICIYSIFSDVMKKHNNQIYDLQKEIRDYLKIDLEW